MAQQYGGSFAPPLTAEKIAAHRETAEMAPPQVKEVMLKLCEMAEVFQQTPASTLPGTPHPSGRGLKIPLEAAEIKRIWDYVPWDYECKAYQALFDALPTGPKGSPETALRDAAFHLLWYAIELEKDREPMTNDKL